MLLQAFKVKAEWGLTLRPGMAGQRDDTACLTQDVVPALREATCAQGASGLPVTVDALVETQTAAEWNVYTVERSAHLEVISPIFLRKLL